MDKQFLYKIFDKGQNTYTFPSNKKVCKQAEQLFKLLFPEKTNQRIQSFEELQEKFTECELKWTALLSTMQNHLSENAADLSAALMNSLPEIYETLLTDIEAIHTGDPAAKSEFEVIRTYPGVFAISYYRLAHSMHKLGIPFLPRILTEYAHSKTGIDIHPGARIDKYFFIDHGTGITIGETCIIGKHVKLYQGITLGALSVSKNLASTKRHPTIEDNVVIYSGATILGGETIVGHDSIIGGNVWLTNSVAPFSKVYHQSNNKHFTQDITE
ncbi:serine O-acetyltransferase [Solitalea koreensis]|uniref:Serine O-acetyltransferase n=1 Tax=Solitalea koreensis TaxID=543615 RepID=A0A521BHN6_9SPHI|nr:serine O-acetyltransferase [Solitalea koreensis]SMO46657.1 serine O-acetyltransferase [Solitalea koreensis]